MVVVAASKMQNLGIKHHCTSCGARFYDLGGTISACPKCRTPISEMKRPEPEPLVLTRSAPDKDDDDDDVRRSRLLGGLDREELELAEADDIDNVYESFDDDDDDASGDDDEDE